MEKRINYRNLSDGPIEVCREMADALYRHQADVCRKYKDVLSSMNFDNRLKRSFDAARERFVCVAYDENKPVGFIFCEAFVVTAQRAADRPEWAAKFGSTCNGLYPSDLPIPVKAGLLNNLYIYPEYRGYGIGGQLMNQAMTWLDNVPGAEFQFVHVSNGNNAGSLYEKYGFHYLHGAFDGIIDVYMRDMRP